VILVALEVAVISVVAAIVSDDVTRLDEVPIAVSAVSILIVVFAACVASHHRMEITTASATLTWFPFYRRTFALSEIDSVTLQRVRARDYGLGLRITGWRQIGLINRGGTAVRITRKSGRGYLIVMRDDLEADDVLRLLGPWQPGTIGGGVGGTAITTAASSKTEVNRD
jgi:hypothetical protein